MRKCILKPHLKLSQVYKRIQENKDKTIEATEVNDPIRLSQRHTEGPPLDDIPARICQQFHKVQVLNYTFATALRDSCCILKNSQICVIKNIIQVEEDVFLIVQQSRIATEVYNVGVTLDSVGVYHCTNF